MVLHLLDGSPRRFKTFVGNRVATILELLPAHTWKHVPTQDNPADCASRGMLPEELITHSLWGNGPPWLLVEPPQLPSQPLAPPIILPEVKAVCLSVIPASQLWLEDKYSSFTKLLKTTAWILRFQANLKARECKQTLDLSSLLTASELKVTEAFLHSRAQCRCYSEELTRLSAGKTLKPSSPILSLNPTIGSGGLLTMGGRLGNSKLSSSQRHPVILHGKDPLTKLLVM